MNAPVVGTGGLMLVAGLVLASAGLSMALQLGLARGLLIAALRTTLQLLFVGWALHWVFGLQSRIVVAGVLVLMLALASREIRARQERRLAGGWTLWIGSFSMTAATVLATVAGLIALHVDDWFDAKVIVPLLGIVLGNVMNGVSLCLNAFHTGVVRDRSAIEARLAMGAPRDEALRPTLMRALRAALIPAINQMSAAGIITLPGMMTGQVLAGMPVIEAAKYQILVLLLVAGGATLGAIGAGWLAVRRISDDRHRLRLDRLAGEVSGH